MYREIIGEMEQWMVKKERKPLLLTGARESGKTWAAKDFAAGFFNTILTVDFEKQEYAKFLFEKPIDKNKVIKKLDLLGEGQMKPGGIFILLENIHLLKDAFDAVEFLFQEMSEYHVCCTTYYRAEYLFETRDYQKYLEELTIAPLSFGEFLIANKESFLYSKIENQRKTPLNAQESQRVKEYLKLFQYIGGMPAVVKSWLNDKAFTATDREIQCIMNNYEKDFNEISSYPLKLKVFQVWESIGVQLRKENKKFQYGLVKLTARAREYTEAVEWLYNRRYIEILYKIKEGQSPVSQQVDKKSFQVFYVDTGLLSYVYEKGNGLCRENAPQQANALLKQFIFQELSANKNIGELFYWTSEATARIEFIFEDSSQVVPVNINLDGNKKTQNLKVFQEKYKNTMSIRITSDIFSMEGGILNIPVYSIWNL